VCAAFRKPLIPSILSLLPLLSAPPSPQLTPTGDYVLAKVAAAETKTAAGVMLPTSAQRMPTSGDVVSTGDGNLPGSTSGPVPIELKAGDTILYSKFGLGCTDLLLGGDTHILLRAADVIGTMPRTGARAEDVPELKPLGDRVLLRVQESASVTAGGVVLPESAKERPMAGEVVRTGPGKWDEEAGERVAPKVRAGDRVLYFKYAGDALETPAGEKFTVVHESDILCKT
jgi:chaperonin GroES